MSQNLLKQEGNPQDLLKQEGNPLDLLKQEGKVRYHPMQKKNLQTPKKPENNPKNQNQAHFIHF